MIDKFTAISPQVPYLKFFQWSILYVLFNFCTLFLNHSVE